MVFEAFCAAGGAFGYLESWNRSGWKRSVFVSASRVEREMYSSFCLLSDCAIEAAGLGMGLHYRDQL